MDCRDSEIYKLKLYVAGRTPRSAVAISKFELLCREHLAGMCSAEVIDLVQNPKQARVAQIFATPTLVKESPAPIKRFVGTLLDTSQVIEALGL